MLEPDFFFFHGAFISKLIPGETFYERKDYKYCTIEYVFHGRGVLKENGFCRQLGKDSIYFLHKYGDHRCENDPHDPWRKIFVMLDGSLMENLIDGYGLKSVYAIENAQELKHFFTEFLYLERRKQFRNANAAVLFHEFCEACARKILREKQKIDPRAEKLCQLLDALGKEEKFSLQEYAKSCSLSAAQLTRIFQAAYGCSPTEYRLRIRLDMAQRQLCYSNFSIKWIAEEVGFSDPYNFSNFFKRRTGVSPSEYRRRKLL